MAKYKNFKVDILGEKWFIKFDNPVFSVNLEKVAGTCDFPTKTIIIDNLQDKKDVNITMVHELFHAYVRRSGIYNGSLSFDMEEIIADQFSTVLCECFDFKL